MKVNIGRTIVRERKARGWTQSDFADRIGVTKAAVSKWELAQSYPDVPLLPLIAATFGISLEDLFDCRAELTEEEQCALIADVNTLLCRDFEQGMERCRELAREHATSGGLLIALATMLSSTSVAYPDKSDVAFELAERLLDQADMLAGGVPVAQGVPDSRSHGSPDVLSVDSKTAKLSIVARISLLSLQGRTDEAVLLAERARPMVAGPDFVTSLLASLYCQAGRERDARRLHQESLLTSVYEVVSSASSLAQLYAGDPERMLTLMEGAQCVRATFDLADDPLSELSRTYERASARLASGAISETVDELEEYVGGLESFVATARSGASVQQPLPELFDLLEKGEQLDKPLEGALLASVVTGLATNVDGDARWEAADVDPRMATLRERLEAIRQEASELGECTF